MKQALIIGIFCLLCIAHARIPPNQRKFNSTTVNAIIDSLTPRFKDQTLASLFNNCLPNTLDTTVQYFTPGDSSNKPDAFIITGDIDGEKSTLVEKRIERVSHYFVVVSCCCL